MFRRLLLWIILLALPMQGVAGASMIRCGALHSAQAGSTIAADGHHQVERHSHAFEHRPGVNRSVASAASIHLEHSRDAATSVESPAAHSQDASGHADRDASCCAAAFAMTAFPKLVFPPAAKPAVLLYLAGVLPSVFLEGLRRPPRAHAA